MKVKNVNPLQGIQNGLKDVDLSRVMKRQNLVLRKKRAKVTAFQLRCLKNILHMTKWGGWPSHTAPPCPTTSKVNCRQAKICLVVPSTGRAPDTIHHDIRPQSTGEMAGIQNSRNLDINHSSTLRRRIGRNVRRHGDRIP